MTPRGMLTCEKCDNKFDGCLVSIKSIKDIDFETREITCDKCGNIQLYKPLKGEYLANGSYRYNLGEINDEYRCS